ncbi:hypothetical protein DL98DRAFT_318652 [Cadophora sp. DSE1049]|nr:hypothetical protein DL98DRAFT_318652 [Cadophora sp. DSE1049]
MTSVSRKKNGCTSCRRRHLKCDNIEPSCANCVAANLECARVVNVRFRHVTDVGPLDPEQKWVKTASRNRWYLPFHRGTFTYSTKAYLSTSPRFCGQFTVRKMDQLRVWNSQIRLR